MSKTLRSEGTTAKCFKNTSGKFLLPLQSKETFAVNLRRQGDVPVSCGYPKMGLMCVFALLYRCLLKKETG